MSNKIILERTVTKKEPLVYVAASDALSGHISKADYTCDGTDDEQQIQDALDSLENTNGCVLLSEGTFNADITGITLYDYVSLKGVGRGATILKQNATNTTLINAEADRVTISDMWLQMPTSDSGDTIQATGTGNIIGNLIISGGTSTSNHIHVTDSFSCNIHDITGQGGVGNVLRFDHSGSYFYGNGKVSNVQCSPKADCTGIYMDANNNLIHFSGINFVTGLTTGNGIKGIHLDGCNGCTWQMIDLEGLDYGVYCEDASNHLFNWLYSTAKNTDIYLDEDSGNNIFIGQKNGTNTWKIVNNGRRELSRRNIFINTNKYIHEIEPPIFYDDFIGAAINPIWHSNITPTLSNGLITLLTGSTTGNTARIDFNGNGGYKDLYETYMEFKAKRTTTGTYDVYMGLTNSTFNANNHAAYFRALNTDENWQCCVSGSACTPTYTPPYTVDTGVPVDTALHTFKIKKDNYMTGVQFFIDDVHVGDLRHCVPATNIYREPVFEVITQEDAANSISIDYVLLQQGRALTP